DLKLLTVNQKNSALEKAVERPIDGIRPIVPENGKRLAHRRGKARADVQGRVIQSDRASDSELVVAAAWCGAIQFDGEDGEAAQKDIAGSENAWSIVARVENSESWAGGG